MARYKKQFAESAILHTCLSKKDAELIEKYAEKHDMSISKIIRIKLLEFLKEIGESVRIEGIPKTIPQISPRIDLNQQHTYLNCPHCHNRQPFTKIDETTYLCVICRNKFVLMPSGILFPVRDST